MVWRCSRAIRNVPTASPTKSTANETAAARTAVMQLGEKAVGELLSHACGRNESMANAAVAFAELKPHSLHLSFQLEKGRPSGEPPPPQHLMCLLILGGDVNFDENGTLREKRLHQREIYNEFTGLDFG